MSICNVFLMFYSLFVEIFKLDYLGVTLKLSGTVAIRDQASTSCRCIYRGIYMVD